METKLLDAVAKLKGEDYWWRSAITFAGFDVGKRGNPSHCSVFAILDSNSAGLALEQDEKPPDDIIVMIHQKFLDNWDYIKQVNYLTALTEYFNIQKLYYDNTRGEMEERSLSRACIPIILSNRTGPRAKGKIEMATNFAKLVEQKRMILLDDDRFVSQITCVTGDLQAPNTPRGHGDSFISIMLAVAVYYDYYASDRLFGTSTIGNIQDLVDSSEKTSSSTITTQDGQSVPQIKKDNLKCKICGNTSFDVSPNGKTKVCQKCFTMWNIE